MSSLEQIGLAPNKLRSAQVESAALLVAELDLLNGYTQEPAPTAVPLGNSVNLPT